MARAPACWPVRRGRGVVRRGPAPGGIPALAVVGVVAGTATAPLSRCRSTIALGVNLAACGEEKRALHSLRVAERP
jgi:hypothetical protein